MNTTTSIRSRGRIVLCALLAFAAPVLAAPQDGNLVSRSVTVNYSDLNLNSAAGVQKLYIRLRGAARKACRSHASILTDGWQEQRKCQRTAIANAVSSLNNERLAAIHRQRTEKRSS